MIYAPSSSADFAPRCGEQTTSRPILRTKSSKKKDSQLLAADKSSESKEEVDNIKHDEMRSTVKSESKQGAYVSDAIKGPYGIKLVAWVKRKQQRTVLAQTHENAI